MDKLSGVQIEIREVLEEYEKLKNIKGHLRDTETELIEAYRQLEKLEGILEDELEDVKKLEKAGIHKLFQKTLGNREKQLEKERQEYLQAALKFNEYLKEVKIMEFEKEILEKKTGDLSILERKLESLKKKRSAEIMAHPNDTDHDVLERIMARHDETIQKSKMIQSAAESGEKAEKLISIIIEQLKKASNWGTWDVLSNERGGDYLKHRSIDKAIDYLPKAQQQLNQFQRELSQLGMEKSAFSIQNIHINKFTDFFFDNLISDWIIQQKINASLHEMKKTARRVGEVLEELNRESEQLLEKQTALEAEKDALLLR